MKRERWYWEANPTVVELPPDEVLTANMSAQDDVVQVSITNLAGELLHQSSFPLGATFTDLQKEIRSQLRPQWAQVKFHSDHSIEFEKTDALIKCGRATLSKGAMPAKPQRFKDPVTGDWYVYDAVSNASIWEVRQAPTPSRQSTSQRQDPVTVPPQTTRNRYFDKTFKKFYTFDPITKTSQWEENEDMNGQCADDGDGSYVQKYGRSGEEVPRHSSEPVARDSYDPARALQRACHSSAMASSSTFKKMHFCDRYRQHYVSDPATSIVQWVPETSKRHCDPVKGQHYWHNSATKRSQWEVVENVPPDEVL